MKNEFKIYLSLFFVVFFWGTSWAVSKYGLIELSPLHFATMRFLIASAIFFILLKCVYKDYKIDKKDHLYLLLLGILGISLYFIILYSGLRYTTTVNSSIIFATSPIHTVLLSSLIFHQEKLTPQKLMGSILAFLGVILVLTNGTLSIGQETLKGDMLITINSILWSLFTILGKELVDKYEPFVVMAYITIYGTLTLLPFTITPDFLKSFTTINIATWGAVMYLAVFCSVYGFYMWYRGIKIIGASRTAMFNYLNPLIAVIVGIIFLKEPIGINTFLGGIAIFAGVYIASGKKANQLSEETNQY